MQYALPFLQHLSLKKRSLNRETFSSHYGSNSIIICTFRSKNCSNITSTANLLFLGWMAISFPFIVIYTGNMYQYYDTLLGHKSATDLSSAYSVIFAVIGAFGSPLIGALSDKIGMR